MQRLNTDRRSAHVVLGLLLTLGISIPVIAVDNNSAKPMAVSYQNEQPDYENLSIRYSRYKNSAVQAVGGAQSNATVTISSTASQTVLGTTTADKRGRWKFSSKNPEVVPCNITAESNGQTDSLDVVNAPADCDGPKVSEKFAILAANDLGMHCADQDYRIFSILPPYNVINAQVIAKGAEPRLVSPDDGIEVTYHAIESNVQDPEGPHLPPIANDSITSTSANAPGVFKSNFWNPAGGVDAHGFLAYDSLYPSVDPFNPDIPLENGILGLFPFETDLGLPAPDVVMLYFGPDGIPDSGDEFLTAHQAPMPAYTGGNEPQHFEGFVEDLPFFISLPMGYTVENFNRFTAEGIPILPVDDQGRENPYPLYRIEAKDANTHEVLATADVVVPVASEADCQQCHASQSVCDTATQYTLVCDDIANTRSDVEFIDYLNGGYTEPVPGDNAEQLILNAAKINILRLHDSKHATDLDAERHIVCANCHYSPALDLAHLGPNDDNGKEQTRHISMSRAMHYSHGRLNQQPEFSHLFPDMPPPINRDPVEQEEILQAACYNCHPGKRTECLRGAMGGGGIVCQDCHGQMAQVGNDFTENFPEINWPLDGSADLEKRVPWASEPMCQSCHIGDVLQVAGMRDLGLLNDVSFNSADGDGNPDRLRLNLAYALSDHVSNGGGENLALLDYSDSRFASNKPLYRLSGGEDGSSVGHGGLSCEGCHGSTHAIWPNKNALANDNATSISVQGHTGTIIECSVCHEGDLGTTLGGPHGMHPVGDTSFIKRHGEFSEHNANACRSCHGRNGEGSVLSRAAVARTIWFEDDKVFNVAKGEPVRCDDCHQNPL